MRKLLFLFIFLFSYSEIFADNSVAFYVVAHQDDWQLFMGLEAYNAMNDSTGTRVIIIHTTAGDASCNKTTLNRAYYIARELGALYSIEFAMDIKSQHGANNFDTVNINGHRIKRFRYKNVSNYFMRLPDGCFSCGYRGQSIQYLKEGKIPAITTVDSTATYNSWEDFVGTLSSIFKNEMDTCRNVWLNVADTNEQINPGDHRDHIYTSLAAQQAVLGMNNVGRHLFTEYHLGDLAINLAPQEVALKAALYGVAEFGREQNNAGSAWSRTHIDFLSRSYYRTIYSQIDSTLNIDDPGNAKQCVLFPNPATNLVNLTYKVDVAGPVTINIADVSGHIVIPFLKTTKSVSSYCAKIELSALAAGHYFVIISTPTYQKVLNLTKL